MSEWTKPIPAPDSDSAPFWDACKEHRLTVQRCRSCGTLRFPPNRTCADCRSTDMEWTGVSGRATLYSWIVVRHPVPREVYAGDVPYVVALVDLEEGVRMVSNLEGCAPEKVESGMPLEVVFQAGQGGFVLPKFVPRSA
jgi:uncharacterized OB-fold protein